MSSRIRQIREYLELQQEIARRLRNPIDLDTAAIDAEDDARQMILQDRDSLVPVGDEMIRELMDSLHGQDQSDLALQNLYRQRIRERAKQSQDAGGALTGPMISSVMQLDR